MSSGINFDIEFNTPNSNAPNPETFNSIKPGIFTSSGNEATYLILRS